MVRNEYGYEMFNVGKSVNLAIAWTVIFILPVVLMVESYSESGDIVVLLFAILLFSPAIYWFIVSFTDRLTIYEKALVEKTLFGVKVIKLNKNSHIYIERITESLYGLPVSMHAKIKVENIDDKLKISSRYKDMGGIVAYLEDFQRQTLLPKALERFHQNQTINFIAIKLSKSQIVFKNKTYKWEDVDRVELEGGVLKLFTHKKKMLGGANEFVEVKSIANLDVCLEVLSSALNLQYV